MKQTQNKKHALYYTFILLASTALHLGCGHIAYSEQEVTYYKKPTPIYSVGHSYYSGPKDYYSSDVYEDKLAMWKMQEEKRRIQYKQNLYDDYDSAGVSFSYSSGGGKCVAWDDFGTCVKKSY